MKNDILNSNKNIIEKTKILEDNKSSKINRNTKTIILDNLKFILGLIFIILLVNGIIRIDAHYITNFSIVSGEQTLTEITQLFLVLITIYSFVKLSFEKKELKQASVLIGCFFVVVFIRELDFLFDLVYHGFWVVPALLVTFSALYYAFKDWRKGLNQMADILEIRAMKVVIIGTILLLFHSRLIGMGSLWKDIMAVNYVYRVKIIIEEGTELLCYFLITFGAIQVRKELKKQK
jgi:hypothetical protein